MKTIKTISLFFLALSIFSVSTNAQDLLTPKKNKAFFMIDVTGSYDLPMMDLRAADDLKSFWSFQDYGVTKGFGATINLKFAVYTGRMWQLRTYATLGYSHFINSDSRAFNIDYRGGAGYVTQYGWPSEGGLYSRYYSPRDTTGVSNIRINIPYLALGAELAIYTDRENKSAFNFGLDYNASVITGRVFQTVGFGGETFNTLKPNLRFGVGANVYYTYKFDKLLGFNVGTRFSLPNLFGKSAEMIDDPGYIYLMDKSNLVLNPNLVSGRTMASLRFFAGLSFYIGKR